MHVSFLQRATEHSLRTLMIWVMVLSKILSNLFLNIIVILISTNNCDDGLWGIYLLNLRNGAL